MGVNVADSGGGETNLPHIECEVVRGKCAGTDHPLVYMSPYQSLDWRRIWARRNAFSFEENVVLAFRSGDQLAAMLPLRITRIAGARTGLIDDGGTGNLNAPIVAEQEFVSGAAVLDECILNAIRRAQLDVDLLYLEKMPRTLLGHRNPLLELGTVRKHRTPTFRGKVYPDFTTWERERFSSAERKLYRRRLRQIEGVLGRLRIFRADTEKEIDVVLDAFDRQRIEAHRARRVPHVFHRLRSRQALREIAGLGLSTDQGFRLYALEAGGHICAVSGVMVQGDYHSGFMTSHDGSLRRFGPGKLLQNEVIRSLAMQGVTEFDLGLGDDDYKKAWAEREWLVDVAMPITPLGRIASSYLQTRNYLAGLAKSTRAGRSILASIRFEAL